MPEPDNHPHGEHLDHLIAHAHHEAEHHRRLARRWRIAAIAAWAAAIVVFGSLLHDLLTAA